MKYEQPITIADAVKRARSDQYLLPGFQRSFVWKPRQISALFDSILRGYPIGSILVWQTTRERSPGVTFRRLVRDYLGPATEPKPARPAVTKRIDAVLDGQQRLTALLIGAAGSYRSSERGKKRFLHIDLDCEDPDAGSEGNMYAFEFRPLERQQDEEDGAWLPVAEALGAGVGDVDRILANNRIRPTRLRRKVLRHLIRQVNDVPAIPIAVERTSDLDRVLNIFARANMGGTKLTYVDLLVGTATSKWTRLDAAEEIRALRGELNSIGDGFNFDDGRIVKAGLVLSGVKDPKFHANALLTNKGAERLEDMWPDFARSMRIAVSLLDSFGLSARTLGGANVVIPVAQYVHTHRLRQTYASADKFAKDRRLVAAFVARTLLRRGYWTGAVDPVLTGTRSAILATRAQPGFPLRPIERKLEESKSIAVDDALIDELCRMRYADRRTLVLLRLLFPDVPSASGLDKDHIFPKSRINSHQVRAAGLPEAALEGLTERADQLPNLQLLDRADNQHKATSQPKSWFDRLERGSKDKYRMQDVKRLPPDLAGAERFWDLRQERLRRRISALLVPPGAR